MKSTLLLAALAASASAHVKLFFDPSAGSTVNPLSIRNANRPTGDGRMSTSGPCGGAANFGANGVHVTSAGAAMTLKFNYNGGHRSDRNELHVIYSCTADGPTEAELVSVAEDDDVNTMILKAGTNPVPGTSQPNYVNAATGNQVRDGYNMMFDLPANMTGRCTVSVLDQRKWGGCVDLDVKPATTMVPPAPGQIPPTTTMMPRVTGEDVRGSYKSPPTRSACEENFGTCCCITAMFEVVHEATTSTTSTTTINSNLTVVPDGAMTRNISTAEEADRLRRCTANGPGVMKQTPLAPLDALSLSGMTTVGMTTLQEYTLKASVDRVAFTNAADSTPLYCDGFAIRWTETARQLEEANTMYAAAGARAAVVTAMLQECNCSANAMQSDQLRSAASEMETAFQTIEALNATATPGERLFVSSTGGDGTAQYTMANFSQSFTGTKGMIMTAAGDVRPPSKSESNAAADTAIAVGVLLVLGLVAAAVVYRSRIAEMLGADEAADSMVVNSDEARSYEDEGSPYSEGAPTPAARGPPIPAARSLPTAAARSPPRRPPPRTAKFNGSYRPVDAAGV